MHKIARICFNTSEWRRPTGDAPKLETGKSYARVNGFGHEEWLFRNEWQIDGWRYSFIQGINNSRKKLISDGEPFDLTVFTIQPDKQRRLVATIQDVECLDDNQAEAVLQQFKMRGWYDTMIKETQAVEGTASALGAVPWTNGVLNMRFKIPNIRTFPPQTFPEPSDLPHKLNRYKLYDLSTVEALDGETSGTTTLPTSRTIRRKGVDPVEYSPEHVMMQKKLMEELWIEFPGAKIVREKECIDVSVLTEQEEWLFEIKSDLSPRTVIRLGLGQILEYAYHPIRHHTLPVRLVIVGRQPLSKEDEEYLCRLQESFGLPITYRWVVI